jgi:cytochrome P450
MTADHDAVAPVIPSASYDVNSVTGVHGHWQELDSFRERFPVFFRSESTPGFWVVTDREAVREAILDPDLFSSRSNQVLTPDPPYKHIPVHYDPPEHNGYRKALNPWFTLPAMRQHEPQIRAFAVQQVASLVQAGRCDYVKDFAAQFAARAFLYSLGLDLDDGPMLFTWVQDVLEGFRDPEPTRAVEALAQVRDHFAGLIADRRAHPRDPERDFLSFYLQATVEDRPLTDDEILDTCETLMLGGLDTARSQLGFAMHHLATHDADRRAIAADSALIPNALEEFLRVYPVVVAVGRKVSRDTNFHGCPMRAGDMVQLLTATENRSPDLWKNATEADIYREDVRHATFGLGQHRCLGSHLARLEMRVALEVWHAAIPEYTLDANEALEERARVVSLTSLPLSWSV